MRGLRGRRRRAIQVPPGAPARAVHPVKSIELMVAVGHNAAYDLRRLGHHDVADALSAVTAQAQQIHAGTAIRMGVPAHQRMIPMTGYATIQVDADESVAQELGMDALIWEAMAELATDEAEAARFERMAARYRLLGARALGLFAEADRIEICALRSSDEDAWEGR